MPTMEEIKNPQAKPAGKDKSIGDTALMDAVLLIVGCWIVVFAIWYSLRRYNI